MNIFDKIFTVTHTETGAFIICAVIILLAVLYAVYVISEFLG